MYTGSLYLLIHAISCSVFQLLHLLILRQEEASNQWIENQLNLSFDFHNNGCSSDFH